MTLDQLRIFIAVAEREHMTLAARHLKLTQSGVSAAISALEKHCQTQLFDRVGRTIKLTDAGKVFLFEAQGILSRVETAREALAEIDELKRGTLRLQSSLTIASYWLPQRLVQFRKMYPQIAVQLAINNTANVAKAVLDGIAEIGFVEGEVRDPLLKQHVIDTDKLAVVVSSRHPAAKLKHVTGDDLRKIKWILREEGSGTRSTFESGLRNLGYDPNALEVALELPSNEAIKTAVIAGAGATAISLSAINADVAAGRLVRLPLKLPLRPYSILCHRDRYRSKMARALLAIVNPNYHKLAGKS